METCVVVQHNNTKQITKKREKILLDIISIDRKEWHHLCYVGKGTGHRPNMDSITRYYPWYDLEHVQLEIG